MNQFNKLKWHIHNIKLHGEKSYVRSIDDSKLRFIIAPGRSGTTWVGKCLSFSTSKIRYISEPLPHYLPRIYNGDKSDHSFASPNENMGILHPFNQVIRACAGDLTKEHFLPDYWKRKVIRWEDNPEFILIKEVHGVLALPRLKNAFPNAKFLVLSRNPLYVVDSLLTYKNMDILLWEQEYKYLCTCYDHEDNIERLIQSVNLINLFLYKFRNTKNVFHISYEELTEKTMSNFNKIFSFMDFKINKDVIEKIQSTMKIKPGIDGHTSIYVNTKEQSRRDFRVLPNKYLIKFKKLMQ